METNHAEILELLETAIARVEILNREGNPVLSAWLTDARAAISNAHKNAIRPMLKLDNPEMQVYVASMRKIFRVEAIARSDAEANEICRKHKELSVMACDKSGLVYLCKKYGSKCPSELLTA
jgi:hypothetical protein